MVTDRKSSWHRGWADFKLYCLLNSRELHSKKLDSQARILLPNGCFPTPSTLLRRISAITGSQCFDVTLFQTTKFKKLTSNNYSLSWGCNTVTKCCLNAISRKCWIPTHTFLETHRHTWTHTYTVYTYITETHIFLAIPCCILTSNSAFNSQSGWVGISVSWMDPTLIQ